MKITLTQSEAISIVHRHFLTLGVNATVEIENDNNSNNVRALSRADYAMIARNGEAKIGAIKIYRTLTGASLVESKKFIEECIAESAQLRDTRVW